MILTFTSQILNFCLKILMNEVKFSLISWSWLFISECWCFNFMILTFKFQILTLYVRILMIFCHDLDFWISNFNFLSKNSDVLFHENDQKFLQRTWLKDTKEQKERQFCSNDQRPDKKIQRKTEKWFEDETKCINKLNVLLNTDYGDKWKVKLQMKTLSFRLRTIVFLVYCCWSKDLIPSDHVDEWFC